MPKSTLAPTVRHERYRRLDGSPALARRDQVEQRRDDEGYPVPERSKDSTRPLTIQFSSSWAERRALRWVRAPFSTTSESPGIATTGRRFFGAPSRWRLPANARSTRVPYRRTQTLERHLPRSPRRTPLPHKNRADSLRLFHGFDPLAHQRQARLGIGAVIAHLCQVASTSYVPKKG